jgi:hypothetical protein
MCAHFVRTVCAPSFIIKYLGCIRLEELLIVWIHQKNANFVRRKMLSFWIN